MEWNEFKSLKRIVPNNLELTDIKCPKCGQYIFRRTDIVLATFPPQHSYVCTNCKWTGTA